MSVRLNKLMAERGIGARRKCDMLIESGAVRVNGKVVRELGIQVEPDRDRVEVEGRPLPGPSVRRTFLFNKPVGVISTLSDPEGRRSLRDFMPSGVRVFPVGRLDADTSGLLLLTNDGELAHHLMHPRYGVPKRYRVHVDRAPTESDLRRLREGIEFQPGVVSAPAQVWVRDSDRGEAVIELALHEGRHRQVRLMCEAVGLEVHRLHRWGYGPLRLGELERGMWRELSDQEIADLRSASARPQAREGGPGRRTGQRSFERPRPRPRDATPEGVVRGGAETGPRAEPPGTRHRGRATVRPARGVRNERPARGGRFERPARSGSSERPARGGRFDRPARGGSSERPARGGRFDRPARGGSSERPARAGRFDRPARTGPSERPGRGGRVERPVRTGGSERQDRGRPAGRPDHRGAFKRSAPKSRDQRPAREGSYERSRRADRAAPASQWSRFERRPARGSFERGPEAAPRAGRRGGGGFEGFSRSGAPERPRGGRPPGRTSRPPVVGRPARRDPGTSRPRGAGPGGFGPDRERARAPGPAGRRSSARGAFPPDRARGGSGRGSFRPGSPAGSRPPGRKPGGRRPGGFKGKS